jgi:BirA family biotin operon repressor/biotin-[acetyl-CoA-carboxylase] ligase
MDNVVIPQQFKLIALETIDSTNKEARRLCAASAPDGTLVWAGSQTAGRGRQGRNWVSPPGNLYCSLVVRPHVGAARATELTFVAAVVVAEAICALLPGTPVRCKWPNDVLIRGRKVAGILLEASASETSDVEWVVIGIGVNVVSHPCDAETLYPATSLTAESVREVSSAQVLVAVCTGFAVWLERWHVEGFATVRDAWLGRAYGLGEPVKVQLHGAMVEGTFCGLDGGGALILDNDGAVRRITIGDILPFVLE